MVESSAKTHQNGGEVRNLTGEYQHSIDAKGRLFIPARLREKLGDVFYVTIGIDKCLSVYPMSMWNDIEQKTNALPLAKARAMRFFFANACRCELDAQGRILLPQKLRNYADLKKDVTVIGAMNHAEIWDSENYRKMEEEMLTPAYLAEVMEDLLF